MGFFEFLFKTIKEIFKFPLFSVLLCLLIVGISIYLIYWLLKFLLKLLFNRLNLYLKKRRYKRIIRNYKKPNYIPAWKQLK